jgi:hypothetical protein
MDINAAVEAGYHLLCLGRLKPQDYSRRLSNVSGPHRYPCQVKQMCRWTGCRQLSLGV